MEQLTERLRAVGMGVTSPCSACSTRLTTTRVSTS
jgi:hypothetical protein